MIKAKLRRQDGTVKVAFAGGYAVVIIVIRKYLLPLAGSWKKK